MASDIGKMHFRRMDEGTDADFAVLARVHEENIRKLPDLLIGVMTNLKADAAYPVDRLQHSLQAATRALRDGRDEEYVVCAVLHAVRQISGAPPKPSVRLRWLVLPESSSRYPQFLRSALSSLPETPGPRCTGEVYSACQGPPQP